MNTCGSSESSLDRNRGCCPQPPVRTEGQNPEPSKSFAQMPLTDDEIREKYLERAIRELNALAHDIHGCKECPRGNLMPVLGSGHPQADILLKHSAKAAEIEEGVASTGEPAMRSRSRSSV